MTSNAGDKPPANNLQLWFMKILFDLAYRYSDPSRCNKKIYLHLSLLYMIMTLT